MHHWKTCTASIQTNSCSATSWNNRGAFYPNHPLDFFA